MIIINISLQQVCMLIRAEEELLIELREINNRHSISDNNLIDEATLRDVEKEIDRLRKVRNKCQSSNWTEE